MADFNFSDILVQEQVWGNVDVLETFEQICIEEQYIGQAYVLCPSAWLHVRDLADNCALPNAGLQNQPNPNVLEPDSKSGLQKYCFFQSTVNFPS